MPIGGLSVEISKRPLDAIQRQPLLHLRITGDVIRIVVISEIVPGHAREDSRREQQQRKQDRFVAAKAHYGRSFPRLRRMRLQSRFMERLLLAVNLDELLIAFREIRLAHRVGEIGGPSRRLNRPLEISIFGIVGSERSYPDALLPYWQVT